MKFYRFPEPMRDLDEFYIWFCPEWCGHLIAIGRNGAVFGICTPPPGGLIEITPEQAFLWIRKQNLSLNDLYTR